MKLIRGIHFQPGFLYLTPLMDLGFVLGLFVVLTTPFLLQPGVAVDVPRSPFVLAPQKNPKVLSITGPPRQSIFYENMEVSPQELAKQLAGPNPPGTLVIKAAGEAAYEVILEVSTIALELGIPVVLATDPPNQE